MKKFLTVCATALLFTTLGFAQGTATRSTDDNQTQYETAPRHDYGWIGLLGLLGLGGLMRRHNTREVNESRSIDSRRAA